jgi:hypothetical protein
MILVATAVVVIVNMLVKIALNIMTQFEGHDTITGATLSKAGKVQAQLPEHAVVQSVRISSFQLRHHALCSSSRMIDQSTAA